jgi:hypothetical protein
VQTKVIEVTNDGFNWGKFLLGRFDTEFNLLSAVAENLPLLRVVGWGHGHLLVLDLQTGEGAIFRPGGVARYDLNQKHQIWVCPMFEPFLDWLYHQDLADLDALPKVVNFNQKDAPPDMYGYRRKGEQRENEGTRPTLHGGEQHGDSPQRDSRVGIVRKVQSERKRHTKRKGAPAL